MSTNINFHGITRVKLSVARHHTSSSNGRTFWARSILITCDDGATQEIGLYSDSESAIDPSAPDAVDADEDESEADLEDDDPRGCCPDCAGTGEGKGIGAHCFACNGSGDAA